MLLCLQPYDVKVVYRPGKEMLLPDTLSCIPVPDSFWDAMFSKDLLGGGNDCCAGTKDWKLSDERKL